MSLTCLQQISIYIHVGISKKKHTATLQSIVYTLTLNQRHSNAARCSEAVVNALALLRRTPLIINKPPPLVHLDTAFPRRLVPRLGTQDVVHVFDGVVAPDGVVHALCAHRLERIVRVRQRDPSGAEEVTQERLIGEVIRHGRFVCELLENEVVRRHGGIDDLQAAVGHGQASRRGCARFLRGIRLGVLRGKGAVLRDPTYTVVSLGVCARYAQRMRRTSPWGSAAS